MTYNCFPFSSRRENSVEEILIRPLSSDDDLAQITALVHSAYAPHIADGLRYWGTWQSVEDTAKRFASGQGYVAETAGQIVATLTVQRPDPDSPVALYREPHTRMLAQFAVHPSRKGMGIGKLLHDTATAFAARQGARVIALDTAAPAARLITLYQSWGYRRCGECDWRPHTNYSSIIMRREVAAQPISP